MQLTFSCRRIVPSVLAWLTSLVFLVHGEETPFHQENILMEAEANREAIEKALDRVPANQRPGLEFLLTHMPLRDLRSLSADFLLENLSYAYRAWRESPWKKQVSEERFFNDVLPYASINERRDAWRKDFMQRFWPLVKDAESHAEEDQRLRRVADAKNQADGLYYSTEKQLKEHEDWLNSNDAFRKQVISDMRAMRAHMAEAEAESGSGVQPAQ